MSESQSPMDVLNALMEERARYEQWLAQLDARRGRTPPHVFERVRGDYGERLKSVLDQLAGRFSPSRGKLGVLVSRRFDNKNLFYDRCRDIAQDGRGFILALDDGDLGDLVQYRKTEPFYQAWEPLKKLFDALVS